MSSSRTLLRVLLVVALALTVAAAGADFYKVLGIKKSASDREIKKACEFACRGELRE